MSGMAHGTRILVAGALVLALSLGVRHAFGLFLQPVSAEYGWGREVFAFAIALQNLVWGLAQPAAGMIADRYGARPVILVGALFYLAGTVAMPFAAAAPAFIFAAGVLVGIGLAGTTMPIVFGAISRALPPERRSMAFGVAMSVGSIGQFVLLPGAVALIDGAGWVAALLILSAALAFILPLGLLFRVPAPGSPGTPASTANPLSAVRTAFADPGFRLLSFGFFVCGFQVIFVATHLPAYLMDNGLPGHVGAVVLALIGLFNIAGSLLAGWLGSRRSKPRLLSAIYLARGVAFVLLIFLPPSEITAYAFACFMGLLWLSTVPLTNAIVASMFGVAHMSLLGGLIFLAHQVGSFLGGWLGGLAYDATQSYDLAWGIAIALSLLAALANWPVREAPVPERRAA